MWTHSALQSTLEEETFTRFWGCLVTMFGGCARQSKASATSSGIDAKVSEIGGLENKLSKNSRQQKHEINQQEAQTNNLHDQNKQLKDLLDSRALVNAINQAVTTSLKITQSTGKGGAASSGTGFISKLYLGKPRPSQMVPGADGSLNLDMECWYCKDTSHLKDNCIKLNHQLAMEQKYVTPNTSMPCSNLANWRLLCLRTRAEEQQIVVQRLLPNLEMF